MLLSFQSGNYYITSLNLFHEFFFGPRKSEQHSLVFGVTEDLKLLANLLGVFDKVVLSHLMRNLRKFLAVHNSKWYLTFVSPKLYSPVMKDLATSISNPDETASERWEIVRLYVMWMTFLTWVIVCRNKNLFTILETFFGCLLSSSMPGSYFVLIEPTFTPQRNNLVPPATLVHPNAIRT